MNEDGHECAVFPLVREHSDTKRQIGWVWTCGEHGK